MQHLRCTSSTILHNTNKSLPFEHQELFFTRIRTINKMGGGGDLFFLFQGTHNLFRSLYHAKDGDSSIGKISNTSYRSSHWLTSTNQMRDCHKLDYQNQWDTKDCVLHLHSNTMNINLLINIVDLHCRFEDLITEIKPQFLTKPRVFLGSRSC